MTIAETENLQRKNGQNLRARSEDIQPITTGFTKYVGLRLAIPATECSFAASTS